MYTVLIVDVVLSYQRYWPADPPDSHWSSLLTYQLRRDGFVYVSASDAAADAASTASFTTKPLVWGKGELKINADCSSGGGAIARLLISVLDSNDGKEVVGFGKADAIPVMHSNSTNSTATWSSGAAIASLAGKSIALHVQLDGTAKLYALRGLFTWTE